MKSKLRMKTRSKVRRAEKKEEPRNRSTRHRGDGSDSSNQKGGHSLHFTELSRFLLDDLDSDFYVDEDLEHCKENLSYAFKSGEAVELIDTSESDSESESEESLISYNNKIPGKVRFSNVTLRVYSLTVGDTAKKAYPLSLDWKHTASETIRIDLFEEIFSLATRGPRARGRGGFRVPPRLTAIERFERLVNVTGQSHKEIYALDARRHRLSEEELVTVDRVSVDDEYHKLKKTKTIKIPFGCSDASRKVDRLRLVVDLDHVYERVEC